MTDNALTVSAQTRTYVPLFL